jgi:hypothetical protein
VITRGEAHTTLRIMAAAQQQGNRPLIARANAVLNQYLQQFDGAAHEAAMLDLCAIALNFTGYALRIHDRGTTGA